MYCCASLWTNTWDSILTSLLPDHLKFSYNGEELIIPESHISIWESPETSIRVERTSRQNSILDTSRGCWNFRECGTIWNNRKRSLLLMIDDPNLNPRYLNISHCYITNLHQDLYRTPFHHEYLWQRKMIRFTVIRYNQMTVLLTWKYSSDSMAWPQMLKSAWKDLPARFQEPGKAWSSHASSWRWIQIQNNVTSLPVALLVCSLRLGCWVRRIQEWWLTES